MIYDKLSSLVVETPDELYFLLTFADVPGLLRLKIKLAELFSVIFIVQGLLYNWSQRKFYAIVFPLRMKFLTCAPYTKLPIIHPVVYRKQILG